MRKLIVPLVLLSACGAVVNGRYQGVPIATLEGQLSLATGVALTREVRLAIAWYPPMTLERPGPPKAVVTEEVSYRGSFPQNFSFRLFNPPAEAAVTQVFDEQGGPAGRGAIGQLVAYEDLDGDGRLSVDARGLVVDRLLGSTAGAGAFDFFTVAERYLVVWVQDGATLELDGVRPGYNLVHFGGPLAPPEVVPLSTLIPLTLTGEPRLALLSCVEAYEVPQPETACGLPLWDTPAVNGSIALSETGSLSAFVMVSTAAGTSSSATVRINGTLVPHDGSGLAHALVEDTPSVLRVGRNTVVVEHPGFSAVTLEATVPSPFTITAPVDGATVTAGAPLDVSWTPAAGARTYVARVFVGHLGNEAKAFVEGPSARLVVAEEVGAGEVSVSAYDHLVVARTAILGVTTRRVAIDVTR